MGIKSNKIKFAVVVALCVALLISIGINVYQAFWSWDSYLQSTDEIYVMESGIIHNNLQFSDGEEVNIKYDFSNSDYTVLKEKYDLESIAKDGSEFDKVMRLMNEFSCRLTHKSDYDNHIEPTALTLLEYSLDNSKQGINCRAKAQILNEICLSLGIYSRKVWIMPYSKYDGDCHVVN